MESQIAARLLRGLWTVLAALLMAAAVYYGLPLVYPLLLAWLLAYAARPLTLLLCSFRLPLWLSVALSLLTYIGGAALIVTALLTKLVSELMVLSRHVNLHAEEWGQLLLSWSRNERLQTLLERIGSIYQSGTPLNPSGEAQGIFGRAGETIGMFVTELITGFFNLVLKLLSALPGMGSVLMIVVLAAFFIGTGWEKHKMRLLARIPAPLTTPLMGIWSDLHRALIAYLTAQLVLISVSTVTIIIGLALLGVPSAFTIGLMIGFVDFIPYFGVGIVLLPWALYAYLTGSLGLALGLIILYAVILIARQVLEPKILASSIGLDPLYMLIGMFAGVQLMGMAGLIAAPVLLVLLDACQRAGVFRSLRSYIMSGRLR